MSFWLPISSTEPLHILDELFFRAGSLNIKHRVTSTNINVNRLVLRGRGDVCEAAKTESFMS